MRSCDRREVYDKANFLMEQSWALIRFAKSAFEHGNLSLRDYKYIKQRADAARSQFHKAMKALDAPVSCETCKRQGDDDLGGCEASSRMSAHDVMMCNEGHCPYWVGMDEDENGEEPDDVV